MDVGQLAKEGGGWIAAAMMVMWFARAWMQGDIVSGKTHDHFREQLDRVTIRAEMLVDEQRRESAIEREKMMETIRNLSGGNHMPDGGEG